MEDDLGDALPSVEGREAEKVVDPPVRDDASSMLAYFLRMAVFYQCC